MNQWIKRGIALFMSVVMLTSATTIPTIASEESSDVTAENDSITTGNSNITENNSNATVESGDKTNTVVEKEYCDYYAITGITVEGNTATVSYKSMEKAIMVVALYTEDGVQLFNSAKAMASPDKTTVTVEFEGEMPEYFMVLAYLVDTYDFTPLCEAYETDIYTMPVVASGRHGENLIWKLYENGKLIIFGNGEMEAADQSEYPWYAYRDSITSLRIMDTVTSVGGNAFTYYKKLEEVDLGDGVRVINGYAFRNCTALTSVTMPVDCDWVTQPFFGCGNVKTLYYTYGQTGIMVDGTGSINSRYYGYALPNYSSNSLENVIFEEGITYIGDYALYGAKTLKNVTLPSTLKSIGDYAFYGTSSMTAMDIPDGVSELGTYCFAYSGLLSMGWPVSLTAIPNYCFFGSAFKKVEVPNYITSIGANAFDNCKNLQEVILGDGVRVIYTYAFRNCTALTDLTMPVDVDWVSQPFYGCSNVKTLYYTYGQTGIMLDGTGSINSRYYGYALPNYSSNSLENVIFEEGITYIGDYALYGAKTLKNVTLPSTLKSIGDYAFYGTSSMTSIDLPDSVSELGTYCFAYSGLLSMGWPVSLTAIPNYCFSGSAFEKVEVPNQIISIGANAFDNCKNLKEVILGNGVRVIYTYAFRNCTALTDLTMPVDVDWVSQPFYGCSNVKTLYYTYGQTGVMLDGSNSINNRYCSYALPNYSSNSLENVIFEEGITYIGDYALYGAKTLKNVTLPSTLKGIGDYAFYGTSSMTSIDLPDSVAELGTYCFANSGLLSIGWSASLTAIPNYCFMRSAFEKVEVPNQIISIGANAFDNCENLKEVILGNGVRVLYGYAFRNCTALTNLTMPVDVDWFSQPFSGCNNVKTLYYTYGQTGLMLDGSNSINNRYYGYALPNYSSNSLETVIFEEGITYIGDYALYGAKTLKTITLPSTLTGIGNYAFAFNTGLTEVYLTGDVPTIGSNAFNSVTATVYYPSGNTTWIGIEFGNYGGTLTWKEYELENADTAAVLSVEDEKVKTVDVKSVNSAVDSSKIVYASTNAEDAENVNTVQNAYAAGNAPAVTSFYEGETSSEIAELYTIKTSTFANLVPCQQYVFLSVKNPNTEDVLATENVLYITQAKAKEDGSLTISYADRESVETSYVILCGPSAQKIKEISIALKPMYANGKVQSVDPIVTYGDERLVEGWDYILLGTLDYTKAGTYTCFIRGINDYTGLFECTYTVLEPLAGTLTVNGTTDTITKVVGNSVTIHVAATGGSGSYTYKYAVYNVATGNWFVLKDFCSDTTYTTKLSVAGTKQFAVTIKDSNGVTVATNRITVKANAKLSGSLQADGVTTELIKNVGDSVTLKAVANGGMGGYTYKFAVFNEKTGSWFVLQDFSSKSTYTSGLKFAGAKQFAVTIKDSTGTTIATNRVRVVVQELSGILQMNGSTSSVTMNVGSSITLEALAMGGSGGYTYKFAVQNADTGTWAVLQDFSEESTCDFVLKTTGNKIFVVTVKDSTGDTVATNRIAVTVTK